MLFRKKYCVSIINRFPVMNCLLLNQHVFNNCVRTVSNKKIIETIQLKKQKNCQYYEMFEEVNEYLNVTIS